ncbi:MAG: FAD:protein FMN transferase, partial [Hyphomicrobiales bacterium]
MLISRRGTILGMMASGFGLALPSWAGSHIVNGQAFGGFWRLITADTQQATRARSVVDAVVGEITNKMSPYRADSELSRFNASQSSDWQNLSEASCFVAAEALRIAALSGGAFDPTVGPIVARFGFGPIHGAMGRYDDLVVGQHAIRKRESGLTLDLCGIAKGYAVDRVSEGLLEAGIEDAMI